MGVGSDISEGNGERGKGPVPLDHGEVASDFPTHLSLAVFSWATQDHRSCSPTPLNLSPPGRHPHFLSASPNLPTLLPQHFETDNWSIPISQFLFQGKVCFLIPDAGFLNGDKQQENVFLCPINRAD